MNQPPAPLLLHVFPSFVVGGAQTRFAAIANRFGRSFRHAIVAMDGNLAYANRLSADLDVSYPTVSFRKGALVDTLASCRRILHELQPSLLITSNWGSIEWAIANLIPLVRHVHMEDGFGPEERHAQLRRRVLTRRFALRRSTVVLPSHTLHHIATDTWKLNPQRLRYIPNGVNLASPNVPDDAPPPWPTNDLPVIGTVAVLRAEKNIARLLRAFAQLSMPARLVIVGDGPARPSLEALSDELAIADRVHFVGHTPAPIRLYRHFDLFALSSDTEQMPLSVLEAMSAALPVVSTDVGDVRQMLSRENEKFVVACDDGALATSLELLLRDPTLRRTIGAANQTKARAEYDAEKMFRMHHVLWSNVEAK